jgi:DNA replication protein DnaC
MQEKRVQEERLQEKRVQRELMLKEVDSSPQNLQYFTGRLVGFEPALAQIRSKLKSVNSLGLTGMGGIGKSTLAKKLFNELGCKYEYSCFVPDVKLIPGTAENLKKEVWKFLYRKGQKEGQEEKWFELRGKHVLLVLDDVSKERDVKPFLEIAVGFSGESDNCNIT